MYCTVLTNVTINVLLILLFCRLAESTDGAPNTKKTSAELREDLEQNKAKRKIINDLQSKNRYVQF
jgi:hypothetical protein